MHVPPFYPFGSCAYKGGGVRLARFPAHFPGRFLDSGRMRVLVKESGTAGLRLELRGGQYCTGDTRLVVDPVNLTVLTPSPVGSCPRGYIPGACTGSFRVLPGRRESLESTSII
eukprot:641330-Prymnesium_polylepis.2